MALTVASAFPALAAVADQTLLVNDARTLNFATAIGRIEVSAENVIDVTAPTARSLRITGIGAGETTLSVYSADGRILRQALIAVSPRVSSSSGGVAGVMRPGEKVVAVDVQFAAVNSSTLKALGFNFSKLSGDIQGAVVSPSSLTDYAFGGGGLALKTSAPLSSAFNLFLSARNRGIGAVLSALSSNGLSQLLAQPTLLVRSGDSAEFNAGGRFPIPVPQSSGFGSSTITIQYEKFGINLKVTPYVLGNDHIVMRIRPEVSELDYGSGVQLQGYTVPGIRERFADTTVELGSGQSFVIAGLNYTNSQVTKDKVPFLGDIPVLGAFFKRQQNQKERQELIIVATPRLVEPGERPPLSDPAALDPSVAQMISGKDGVEKAVADFGVVRR
ncbi:pilus assembly protein N-terminal domain-containing protein [uncultured Novosphingobium sp.]|uniref:type II and III secretion system protein family protein n=1 Tax=uncultured Novosphingobium sp. TaxID=292277 RepID=UPI002585B0FA|nr:pilus assembly protein N-terminal domain-containing protein [uncultured Novosphingobium sp.]